MADICPLSSFLALCPRPTEPILAKELSALRGVQKVEERRGAVSFTGGLDALYRANLHLRSATRILLPMTDQPCRGERELYQIAREVAWEEFIGPDGTLAVGAHGTLPGLTNTMFTAVRVKDSVVDRFRDRFGRRPNVYPESPDLRIDVQLYESPKGPRVALSVDSSGTALHQRGYWGRQGRKTGEAPMKETLAAAIVLSIGEGHSGPIVDPCCGSGTLLIEAGMLRAKRAPGLSRVFGFQRWRGADRRLFAQLCEEAVLMQRPHSSTFLYGRDINPVELRRTRENLAVADLLRVADLQVKDLRETRPPSGGPGIVVANPPYGERMADPESLIPLYRSLGDTLKRHFSGYTAFIYTANSGLAKQIGLRPQSKQVFFNGNLEGCLLRFDLY